MLGKGHEKDGKDGCQCSQSRSALANRITVQRYSTREETRKFNMEKKRRRGWECLANI
jgi:hypothetical protein